MEELLYREGLRSYLIVPFVARGRSVGTLNVASIRPRQYDESDAEFLEESARQCALAVANMRSYERITTLNRLLAVPAMRYRTLLEISNAIINRLTQDELFEAISRALSDRIPFDRIGYSLYDPERDQFRLAFDGGGPLLYPDIDAGTEVRSRSGSSPKDTARSAPFPSSTGDPPRSAGVASARRNLSGQKDAELLSVVVNMRSYEEIASLRARLRRTALDAADRLHDILMRMRRFTNLDRSESLTVDLNLLLQDVVDLLDPTRRSEVEIRLDFGRLPPIRLRPHLMSVAFDSLLHHALERARGARWLRLTTRDAGDHAEVTLEDDGAGLSEDEVAGVFEPGVRVEGTGSWMQFCCSQIVREHGGDIELESSPEKGTRIRVSPPF